MSLSHSWLLTPQELSKTLLFHGSIEPWQLARPRAGGYDDCFWTSDCPLIAQTYIPKWGGEAMFSISRWDRDREVCPQRQSMIWEIAKQLGASATDITWRNDGRAESWRDTGKPVTYQQVFDHLLSLGYEPRDGEFFRVKDIYITNEDGEQVLMPVPADRQPFGRLVIVDRPASLALYDLTEGREPDLTDKQYHKVDTFQKAFEAGYQAVLINDFAQSPRYGNVGHTSIGFSSRAIGALFDEGRVISIPATHRDFPCARGDYLTEDYLQWHFSEVTRALALGFPVPTAVIDAHQERFDALLADLNDDAQLLVPVTLDGARAYDIALPAAGSDPVAAEDVAAISNGLRQGLFEQGDATFTLSAHGRLTCLRGATLVEAAEQQGACLTVNASLSDQEGRTVTCGRLREALDYARAPADPAPSF
ncbi:hypothetical protein [Geopseudomonas aromaticivorans]